MPCPWLTVMSQSTVIANDASSAWPTQRRRTLDTSSTPRIDLASASSSSTELGIYRIHEAAEHLGGRLAEHEEDRDRDQQAHDWVGERVAERDAHRAGDDGERREAIGPRVVAVGHEAADPDSRPTRIWYRATASLPANSTSPAAITAGMLPITIGLTSRLIDS